MTDAMETAATGANATMRTFGYPDTLIADYARWSVLLRPRQVTLGALVLVCKEPVTAFSAISRAAFNDLERVTKAIEHGLAAQWPYNRINYLMLMMEDPDVHFHVVPRYDHDLTLLGSSFRDIGWPGVPNMDAAVELTPAQTHELTRLLRDNWPGLV